MARQTFAVACLVACMFAAELVQAAGLPIRLARHPDYHAGKVTFSYLGDIWVANEDGTGSCG